MDDSVEDPKLPHHRHPKEPVSLDRLAGTLSIHVYICILVYIYVCVYFIP